MTKERLIIFVRNFEPGKVKTRLANTIGDEKALEVYQMLVRHTREITIPLNCSKTVYYSESVDEHDDWDPELFEKHEQKGKDLGERMHHAFEASFQRGFSKVSIIGSDCLELNTRHILDAFKSLDKQEIVLGPASDGGYYLLGMKEMKPALFRNKAWSTSSVFADTLNDAKDLGLSYSLLPELSDIDRAQDLYEHLTG